MEPTENMSHRPKFKIKIDREQYEVDQEHMSGAQLRRVPPTPIPPDRDLYEVRPGQDDNLIADDEVVTIRNGLRFFTAPGQINPGRR
jgi:hypothetical protein